MTIFFESRSKTRTFVSKSSAYKLEDRGKNSPPRRRWAAVVQRDRQITI